MSGTWTAEAHAPTPRDPFLGYCCQTKRILPEQGTSEYSPRATAPHHRQFDSGRGAVFSATGMMEELRRSPVHQRPGSGYVARTATTIEDTRAGIGPTRWRPRGRFDCATNEALPAKGILMQTEACARGHWLPRFRFRWNGEWKG